MMDARQADLVIFMLTLELVPSPESVFMTGAEMVDGSMERRTKSHDSNV